ncbi:MAG: type III secretion system ATPase SctN [Vulcanimicrobiaceae bacterium]
MTARGAGWIVRTLGDTAVAALPGARVGDGVVMRPARGEALAGEIAAVEHGRVTVSPFGSLAGIAVGDRVEIDPTALEAPVGFAVLGRAIDARGEPVDGGPALRGARARVDRGGAPQPAQRAPVCEAFWTGTRAIDGLLTIGRGARIGFFGAPGAGKTTLLESIVAGARADAVVLALVGERGREAQAWFARVDRRTAIVCATSDRSPAERVRAADVAMAQARTLCDRGMHVLLVVDSLARYASALREARVALGEPIGRGGYPPSVWAQLARYLEGAGNAARGSITLLATVLSDGADDREPLSDAARSLLDGHIVLSSALANAGHYPAIDVLASTSRTMSDVVDADHARSARAVRAALALLAQSADGRAVGLANLGDPSLAAAIGAEAAIGAFVRQRDGAPPAQTRAALHAVAALVPHPGT